MTLRRRSKRSSGVAPSNAMISSRRQRPGLESPMGRSNHVEQVLKVCHIGNGLAPTTPAAVRLIWGSR